MGKQLEQLSPWLQELVYNPTTRQWHAKLKPKGLIVVFDFDTVIANLERHVVNEILALVAAVLKIEPSCVARHTRNRNIVDLRTVTTIIIQNKFDSIRQRMLCKQLGWGNRSSVPHANKQAGVREIQQLIEKVYRAYPGLDSGNIEVSNQN